MSVQLNAYRSFLTALLVLVPAALLMPAARVDASNYLEIPGIFGESATPGHPDVIEIQSYSLQSQAFTITKALDSTSPDLFQATAEGEVFPSVSLLLYNDPVPAGPPDTQLQFQTVVITSYQNLGNQLEQATFSYETMVPEPASATMGAMALAWLAAALRRRTRSTHQK